MKKSFKTRHAEKMSTILNLILDTATELAKIDVMEQRDGKLSPEMVAARKKLTEKSDILSELQATEATFADAHATQKKSAHHTFLALIMFGTMAACGYGIFRESQKGNPCANDFYRTLAICAGCAGAYHVVRKRDAEIDYNTAVKEYKNQYDQINARIRAAGLDMDQKIK